MSERSVNVVLVSVGLPGRSECIEVASHRLGYKVFNASETIPAYSEGEFVLGLTPFQRRERVEQRVAALASPLFVVGTLGAFGSAPWRLFTHGILWLGARYEQLPPKNRESGRRKEYLEDRLRQIEEMLKAETESLLAGAPLLRLSQSDSDEQCVEAILRFLREG